jgi:hypothetical protein
MLQYLKKKYVLLLPIKAEKNTPKRTFDFFPYCPELPKQENLCFKMWLIDQHIKLGFLPFSIKKKGL